MGGGGKAGVGEKSPLFFLWAWGREVSFPHLPGRASEPRGDPLCISEEGAPRESELPFFPSRCSLKARRGEGGRCVVGVGGARVVLQREVIVGFF